MKNSLLTLLRTTVCTVSTTTDKQYNIFIALMTYSRDIGPHGPLFIAHMYTVHTYYLNGTSNTYLIQNSCCGRPACMGSCMSKLPHVGQASSLVNEIVII